MSDSWSLRLSPVQFTRVMVGSLQLDPTITLVNCTGGRQTRDPTINPLNSTGGRRGHPHFENQPGKLPGGMRGAETMDLTISLVNCTGGRRRVQGSDNQSLELHGWQAQTLSFSKSIWSTARWQVQKVLTSDPVNCTGGRHRDQGSDELQRWQAQTPTF